MFGIGGMEILVILVVALLLFGPNKLPELAQTVGKALGEFKRATDGVTSAMKMDVNKLIDEPQNAVAKTQSPAPPSSTPEKQEQPEEEQTLDSQDTTTPVDKELPGDQAADQDKTQ